MAHTIPLEANTPNPPTAESHAEAATRLRALANGHRDALAFYGDYTPKMVNLAIDEIVAAAAHALLALADDSHAPIRPAARHLTGVRA